MLKKFHRNILQWSAALMLLTLFFQSYAQKHDYVWYTGTLFDTATDAGRVIIDFRNGEPEISRRNVSNGIVRMQSNICDIEGNPILFTNGCVITNADDHIILNGDSVVLGYLWDAYCDLNEGFILRNILIIPFEYNDSSKYYFIYPNLESGNFPNGVSLNAGHLFVSLVEKEDDKFVVTNKNTLVHRDSLDPTFLPLVKHNNGQDWWLLSRKIASPIIFKYLISNTSVNLVDSQSIGNIIPFDWNNSSQTIFSHDGSRLASFSTYEDIQLWDYDRETGLLSNHQQIRVGGEEPELYFPGIAFSPNGNFLYACDNDALYQYDLRTNDIQSSEILIDTFDGFEINGFLHDFSYAQLGPDCKIYIVPNGGGKYYSTIHQPDRKGKACDFRQHDFYLKSWVFSNLPRFPNYRLDSAPVCDSSLTPTVDFIPFIYHFSVYPNPAQDKVTIENGDLSQSVDHIMLVDILGRNNQTIYWPSYLDKIELDVRNHPPGMYIVRVYSKGKAIFQKKIILE